MEPSNGHLSARLLLVSKTVIPSHVSSRGHKIGPACLLFSTLSDKLFDLGSQKLVWEMTLIKSRSIWKVKVIGQKVKVTRSGNVILKVSDRLTFGESLCHVIWRHNDVMWHNSMTVYWLYSLEPVTEVIPCYDRHQSGLAHALHTCLRIKQEFNFVQLSS